MNPLEELRKKISGLDLRIIDLISERAKIALEVAKAKKQENSPLYRPSREQEIFLSIDQNNPGPLKNAHLHNIYREIMSSALAVEGKLRVAYLGPKGSFTHQAALKKFGHSLELFSYSDVDSVFESVQKGKFQYGILPIENSTEGKVTHTLDALLEYDLHIYSEVHLSVHHYLLGFGKQLEDIKKIHTHRQARSQCRKWLAKNLPQAEWIETASTSQAAATISEKKDTGSAAIASSAAASFYKIPIIEEKIEDASRNFTRFVVISKELSEPSRKDRTSIVFSLPHEPGSLYQILDIISGAKANLTSIESRPNRTEVWSYVFYVDFEGHQEQEEVRALLEKIKQKTAFFRVLGSYPMDVTYD